MLLAYKKPIHDFWMELALQLNRLWW